MFVRVDGRWLQIDHKKILHKKDIGRQAVCLNIDHILNFYENPLGTIFELINGDTILADVSFEEASNWDIWEIC